MISLRGTILILLPILLGGGVNAGDKRETFVITRTPIPVKVDGDPSDKAWRGALKLTSFYQISPDEGIPASEETEVSLIYSRKSLYLLFECRDSRPDLLRTSVTPRDEFFEADNDFVGLYIDSYGDERRAYIFFVNPSGIQGDGIYMDGRGEDLSFDTIFHSAGRLTQDGYFVEVEIPFRSLRFKPHEEVEFGFIAFRNIERKGEIVAYPQMTREKGTLLGQGVIIKGFRDIRPGASLELLPSLTFSWSGETMEDESGGGSFSTEPLTWSSLDPGVNFKYGISPNLTFDTAINPDFSQVEADPDRVDVNLRYPLYYEEKRPFFMEGSDYFKSPIEVLYTRNIVDPIYGVKLTGKAGRMNFGFLNSYDETPSPSLLSGGWSEEDVNGMGALNSVVRLKYDIFSNSHLGFIYSDKTLFHGLESSRYNRVMGADARFLFLENNTLILQALSSWTGGGGDESISDPALVLRYWRAMKYSSFIVMHESLFPDFRAENGFIERTGYSGNRLIYFYRFMINRWKLDYIEPSFYHYDVFEHPDFILSDNQINPSLNLRFMGTTYLTLGYDYYMERWEGVDFHKNRVGLRFNTSPNKYLTLYLNYSQGGGIDYDSEPSYLGYSYSCTGGGTIKPHILTYINIDYTKEIFFTSYRGDEVYNFDILRIKNNLNFTSRWALRTIVEYNGYYDDLDLSLLLSFEYNYGTLFFLGYSGKFETPSMKEEERAIFLKLSWLWRV